MTEQSKWLGLWTCPDFKTAINDSPPFRYKCTGMELSPAAQAEFFSEIAAIISKGN